METVRGGGVLQSLLSDWEVGKWTDVTLVGEDNTRSVGKAFSLQGDSGRNGNMSGAGTSKKYINIFFRDPVKPGLFYKHLCYSLIKSVSQSSFVEIFLKHCLTKIVRTSELKFSPPNTCHMSRVRCHV